MLTIRLTQITLTNLGMSDRHHYKERTKRCHGNLFTSLLKQISNFNPFTVVQGVDEFVLNRFYMTLMLYNLWRQRSIWEVSAVFRVPRGLVQNILNGASTFAACIAHFCQVRGGVIDG